MQKIFLCVPDAADRLGSARENAFIVYLNAVKGNMGFSKKEVDLEVKHQCKSKLLPGPPLVCIRTAVTNTSTRMSVFNVRGWWGKRTGEILYFSKRGPPFSETTTEIRGPPTSKDRDILTGRTLAERRPPQPEPPQVLHARGERQGRRLDGRRG